jgi:outer membrane protein OmpA-like peptidoglycan-associated protein
MMRGKLTTALLITIISALVFSAITMAACFCTTLSVIAIDPNSGLNTGPINTKITGKGFDPKAIVWLSRAGQPNIVGTNVVVNSPTSMNATFDLKGKQVGLWDVVVKNPDNKTASLVNGFTINAPAPTPTPTPVPTLAPSQALKPIFFDLDKSNIKNDQVATLNGDLAYLKDYLAKNPKAYVILGAHCDERGSVVYNTALSTRRGEEIQKYLVSNGIDPNRVIVYSYGKDYPAKPGHDEAAWAFNRRVDVSVWETKPSQTEALKTQ